MTDIPARIRWSDGERAQLAQAMASCLAADPELSLLAAARQAQEACLPAERHREFKAWSIVQPLLQDKLEEAQRRHLVGEGLAPCDVRAGVVSDEQAELGEVDNSRTVLSKPEGMAQRAPESSECSQITPPASLAPFGPEAVAKIEAAFLAALQSPALEDAISDLFARSLTRAVARENSGSTLTDAEPVRQAPRVLLAGFAQSLTRGLEEGLRPLFDVRSWRPNQSPQLLDTLVGMCSVAVIPEEADDEMSDALRQRDLLVIRHEGSPARLIDRLSSVAS